jgi:hypothetical protein
MKQFINEAKRMQQLAGIINESNLTDEAMTMGGIGNDKGIKDIKVGEEYVASMPTDSTEKNRIDVKVKFLGPDRNDPDRLIVTPLQDVNYKNPESGQMNRFEKGKQYGIDIQYVNPLN